MEKLLEKILLEMLKSKLVRKDVRALKILVQAIEKIKSLDYILTDNGEDYLTKINYEISAVEYEKETVLRYFENLNELDLAKLISQLLDAASDKRTVDKEILRKLFKLN